MRCGLNDDNASADSEITRVGLARNRVLILQLLCSVQLYEALLNFLEGKRVLDLCFCWSARRACHNGFLDSRCFCGEAVVQFLELFLAKEAIPRSAIYSRSAESGEILLGHLEMCKSMSIELTAIWEGWVYKEEGAGCRKSAIAQQSC